LYSPKTVLSRSRTAITEFPKVGAEIPTFARETGFANWNRYAAVDDDFYAIHMDDEAGRGAGYATAIGMGNLQWSYLHNVLREWMGQEGRIERLSCQFRGPNLQGQTVKGRGRLIAVRPGQRRVEVDLKVWTESEEGRPLASGNATMSFSVRPEAPQAAPTGASATHDCE
jgi:acyl dehydratase